MAAADVLTRERDFEDLLGTGRSFVAPDRTYIRMADDLAFPRVNYSLDELKTMALRAQQRRRFWEDLKDQADSTGTPVATTAAAQDAHKEAPDTTDLVSPGHDDGAHNEGVNRETEQDLRNAAHEERKQVAAAMWDQEHDDGIDDRSVALRGLTYPPGPYLPVGDYPYPGPQQPGGPAMHPPMPEVELPSSKVPGAAEGFLKDTGEFWFRVFGAMTQMGVGPDAGAWIGKTAGWGVGKGLDATGNVLQTGWKKFAQSTAGKKTKQIGGSYVKAISADGTSAPPRGMPLVLHQPKRNIHTPARAPGPAPRRDFRPVRAPGPAPKPRPRAPGPAPRHGGKRSGFLAPKEELR